MYICMVSRELQVITQKAFQPVKIVNSFCNFPSTTITVVVLGSALSWQLLNFKSCFGGFQLQMEML